MPRPTNTKAVTVAVLTATFLAALDSTVVGTAMPTIIGSMGGLALYSWVFSAYLLTSTTTVPIFGRLSDIYGRKPVFLGGAALFLFGSALCGASRSMEQLILFRAVQGFGAGAVLPVSITVVGDIFSVEQRARVQGLISGVWGVSAILGPAVGGLLVDYLDWRWVFYVNLPFGIVSAVLFMLFLHEVVECRQRSIDYLGTALLTSAVTVLLLGLLEMGQENSVMPVSSWGLVAIAAALLSLFLLQETRAEEGVMPLGLFRSRVFSVANGAGFLGGITLFGISSFVPTFVQGVLGGTAIQAGATIAPLSIGWLFGSVVGGRLMLRCGYRPMVLLGTALIALGSLMLVAAGSGASQPSLMLAAVVVGLGLGFSTTTFTVAVQSSVDWGRRGIATASLQFFSSIGGAIGVALMGSLMNSGLQRGLEVLSADLPLRAEGVSVVAAASVILDPIARTALPPEALDAIRLVMARSLHSVYMAVAAAALAGFALALLFPRGSVKDHAHPG